MSKLIVVYSSILKRCNSCKEKKPRNSFSNVRHKTTCNECLEKITREYYTRIRRCNECKEEKPLTDFRKSPIHPLGHCYSCIKCSLIKIKRCSRCGEKKTRDSFNEYKNTTQCKECLRKKTREYYTRIRRCNKCKEEKHLTNFHKTKGRALGRSYSCIKCHKAQLRKNKPIEKNSKSRKRYRKPKFILFKDKIKSDFKCCSSCGEKKTRDSFNKHKSQCKECLKKRTREYYTRIRRCNRCNQEKPLTDFHKAKGIPLGYKTICKKCNHSQQLKYDLKKRQRERFLDENLVEGIDFIVCQICGVRVENKRGLSTHLRVHGMTIEEYYIKTGLIF